MKNVSVGSLSDFVVTASVDGVVSVLLLSYKLELRILAASKLQCGGKATKAEAQL